MLINALGVIVPPSGERLTGPAKDKFSRKIPAFVDFCKVFVINEQKFLCRNVTVKSHG